MTMGSDSSNDPGFRNAMIAPDFVQSDPPEVLILVQVGGDEEVSDHLAWKLLLPHLETEG